MSGGVMFVLILFAAFAGALIALWVWSEWEDYCIDVTGADRLRVIEWAHSTDEWRKRQEQYNRVTFRQHLQARKWKRNPWLLYSAEIQAAMGAA